MSFQKIPTAPNDALTRRADCFYSQARTPALRAFHVRAQKITHLNRLRKVVHLIAMFPINPDVLDAHVTPIVSQRTTPRARLSFPCARRVQGPIAKRLLA